MSRDYVLQPFRPAINPQIDYPAELNEQQLAAVTAPPGPSLVIAGAGSGKTRTLTYRVAYLLEQGIPADRILLLTFTNKAAREMMRRVTELLGQELHDLQGGTFHSIGNRISIRLHADQLDCSATSPSWTATTPSISSPPAPASPPRRRLTSRRRGFPRPGCWWTFSPE
ncbi:MAG: UvrD-helicase domain-containing protein [Verrucomicrobiota bacterium]